MPLTLATRRSPLALAQSLWVKEWLEFQHPGLVVDLYEVVTKGDRVQDVPLPQVGGKGLFTHEIEVALHDGRADIAVHSLKDLPSDLPQGLCLACVPVREDARDVFVVAETHGIPPDLSRLPRGARLGTSSLRRAAQLLHARPDLQIVPIRGNVDTRLRKLHSGDCDVLVLAAAGLARLGLTAEAGFHLPIDICTPAPGQGALGIECRTDDERTRQLLMPLQDASARRCVEAERALMRELGGGCSTPLGAHAVEQGGALLLTAALASPDGSRLLRRSAGGSDPEALGRGLAGTMVAAGAEELLAAAAVP